LFPQPLQFCGSLVVSTQWLAAGQNVWLAFAHWHIELLQISPAAQPLPQPLQFRGSLLVSTQVVPHNVWFAAHPVTHM
jgi:hypothetical protein